MPGTTGPTGLWVWQVTGGVDMAEGHDGSRLGEEQLNQVGRRQSPPLTPVLNFQKSLRIGPSPTQSQAHRVISESLCEEVVSVSMGSGAESCASPGTSGSSNSDTPFPSLCLSVSKCKRTGL